MTCTYILKQYSNIQTFSWRHLKCYNHRQLFNTQICFVLFNIMNIFFIRVGLIFSLQLFLFFCELYLLIIESRNSRHHKITCITAWWKKSPFWSCRRHMMRIFESHVIQNKRSDEKQRYYIHLCMPEEIIQHLNQKYRLSLIIYIYKLHQRKQNRSCRHRHSAPIEWCRH